MRPTFWSVLALSLAIVALADNSGRGAPPDGRKALSSDEAFDPNTLFPLGKRNGVTIRVESSSLPDEMIVSHNFIPSFVGGQKTLDKVLAHPENATAIQLAVATDMTYRAGNLKEAAFLFYAARLRWYQDSEKYVPAESSSASTTMFMDYMLNGVRVDLLRELYLKPEILAAVVKRIESLALKEPAGYNPGWDYVRHDVSADLFAKNKATVLESLKPTAELLLVPDYFQAFRVYRASYELSEADQKNPEVLKYREKAANAMRRIEKERNLHGLMYQTDDKPVD
jgi:hypothetical protein